MLPTWIERLLTRSESCSEPTFTRFRQDLLRKQVAQEAYSHAHGREALRAACLGQLDSEHLNVVVRAISCLFVVGSSSDLLAVEPLLRHANESVRKAARTCAFEIRRRPDQATETETKNGPV
jgi:hypothetical protein